MRGPTPDYTPSLAAGHGTVPARLPTAGRRRCRQLFIRDVDGHRTVLGLVRTRRPAEATPAGRSWPPRRVRAHGLGVVRPHRRPLRRDPRWARTGRRPGPRDGAPPAPGRRGRGRCRHRCRRPAAGPAAPPGRGVRPVGAHAGLGPRAAGGAGRPRRRLPPPPARWRRAQRRSRVVAAAGARHRGAPRRGAPRPVSRRAARGGAGGRPGRRRRHRPAWVRSRIGSRSSSAARAPCDAPASRCGWWCRRALVSTSSLRASGAARSCQAAPDRGRTTALFAPGASRPARPGAGRLPPCRHLVPLPPRPRS